MLSSVWKCPECEGFGIVPLTGNPCPYGCLELIENEKEKLSIKKAVLGCERKASKVASKYGGDYKDHAYETYKEILARIGSIHEIPDGEECPRKFLAWVDQMRRESIR